MSETDDQPSADELLAGAEDCATLVTPQQYPWESQTMLISFLGTLASLAAAMGFVQLTTEQIAALGAVLFPLIAALRKWSGGEKIVLRKG